MATNHHSGLKQFGAGHPSVHIRPVANGYTVALHDGGDGVTEHHVPSLQNASDVSTTHFDKMAAASKAQGGQPPGMAGYMPPALTPPPENTEAAPAAAPAPMPMPSAVLRPQSSSNLMTGRGMPRVLQQGSQPQAM